MKKSTILSLSISLSIALLILASTLPGVVSPAVPPIQAPEPDFTVNISFPDLIDGAMNEYKYNIVYNESDDALYGVLDETNSNIRLRASENYSGQLFVSIEVTNTLLDVSSNVVISGQEFVLNDSDCWEGLINYVGGGTYAGSIDFDLTFITEVGFDPGPTVTFTIPALNVEIINWISGVTINGKAADEYSWGVGGTPGYYFEYTFISYDANIGTNRVAITPAQGITQVSSSTGPGSWNKVDDWNWDVTFSLDGGTVQPFAAVGFRYEAELEIRLTDGTSYERPLTIKVIAIPPLSLNINGAIHPLPGKQQGDPQVGTNIVYYASIDVNRETGNEIEIVGLDAAYVVDSIQILTTIGITPYDDFTRIDDDWSRYLHNFSDPAIPSSLKIINNGSSRYYPFSINIELRYKPSNGGGGGGGGGGGEEDDIDVINQLNEPDYTSDTILTPKDTNIISGQNVTNVASKEIDALIKLAEAHAKDIEDGDKVAMINIRDLITAGSNTYIVNLKGGDILKIIDSSIDLLGFSTSAGQFRIRSDGMEGLKVNAGSNVQIKLTKMNHEGRTGVDVQMLVASKKVQQVKGAYGMEIRIPYVLQKGEDPAALCVVFISENGKVQVISESRYDEENKVLICFLTHMSKYGVAYRPVLFSDVSPDHWANGYITFLASRNVITTPPGTAFRPDDYITRAEFINMAARAFAVANVSSRSRISYKDVDPEQWYAPAMGWSFINNISPFMADGRNIHPNAPLKREEKATLMNNVSLGLGLRLLEVNPEISYKDEEEISDHSRAGVERMSACGIVFEGGGGNFFPRSECTRAEAARTISLLLSNMR